MSKTSSNFRISNFHNQVVAWLLLTIFLLSFVPSASLAQQPTATIKTLSGNILVSGQATTAGTVLRAGDTIQTEARASVILELSDGSELHLGEKTRIIVADLSQTETGARVSRVKLLWGRIRAFLLPQHQIEGSSFDIETPNALVGVKFSEPDIEVSYNQEKAETVGIAHTVELLAKNLLTDEKVLVPVGSSVIIVGTTVKIIAGMLAIAGTTEAGTAGTGATEAASTGTGATSAGTSSTGSSGMGTGTKVALGVGAAAAAGGVVALVASADKGDSETAESTGDLSGTWVLQGSCIAQGCTDAIPCPGPDRFPDRCGPQLCEPCEVGDSGFTVAQTGAVLSASGIDGGGEPFTLDGNVNGKTVSFTIDHGIPPIPYPVTNFYTGTLDGNTITGTFSGQEIIWGDNVTWFGTFTVTIK